jgi:hypothetical protein
MFVVVVVVEGNLFRTILLSHTNIIRRWYVLTIDHNLQYLSAFCSLCVYYSGTRVQRRTAPAMCVCVFLHALIDLVGHGLFEVHPSHPDTPNLVWVLWTNDQPDAEMSNRQHKTQDTDCHAHRGIWTRNPNKRAAVDPRLRPRGHWVRPLLFLPTASTKNCAVCLQERVDICNEDVGIFCEVENVPVNIT